MMKLTKRILCLTLVLALAIALCACGKKDEQTGNPGGFVTPSDNTGSTGANTSTTVDDWTGNLPGENQFNDATLAW